MNERARGPRRRRLLVGLAIALTILGVGEVAARVLHERARAAVLERHDITDPATLVTIPAPPPLYYEMGPNHGDYTNAEGFCGPLVPRERTPGTYRIAVIGDSVSSQGPPFGFYHKLARRALEQAGLGPVEVLNFAVPGYNSEQQEVRLHAKALEFAPDLVLWQFHDNDGSHPLYDHANGGMGRYYDRPVSALWGAIQRELYRWWRDAHHRRVGAQERVHEFSLLRFNWDRVGPVLERVANELRGRGIPLVVMLYPRWPPEADWSTYPQLGHELHRELTELLESRGAKVLDLLPIFAQHDPRTLMKAADDPWHPNQAGHDLIAEHLVPVLVPFLRDEGS